MNDNDRFEESLRSRLPLPPVSDALLSRLERQAEWAQPRLWPYVVIGLALALLAVLIINNVTNTTPTASRAPVSGEHPASLSIALPTAIPVAFVPSRDLELEIGLSVISRRRLEREPDFHYDLDSVVRRGEGRPLAL